MKQQSLKMVAGATVGILMAVLAYQNCSGRKGDGASVSASACVASSVMRVAFPQGHTFYLPQGISNTPYQCVNQSGYSSVVFNSSNQTLTLQGSSGSVTVNLVTGGSPCGTQQRTGGDNWKATTGLGVDTVLTGSVLQITTTDTKISCNVDY